MLTKEDIKKLKKQLHSDDCKQCDTVRKLIAFYEAGNV